MPRRPRLRPLAPLALAIALCLTACSGPTPAALPASGPGSDPVGVAARAVVLRADAGYAGATVQNDGRSRSVTIVPERSNGALVVYLHGWGQTRWALLERRSEARVAHALVGAGYTMLSADARLKAWGDRASVQDYARLIAATVRQHRLRDVFLIGESMGGLATMQLARALPTVRAVVAWYPVCDLRTMTQARFQPSIAAAWRGADRAAVSPVRVSAKPMLIWASPQDRTVRAATNAAVCAAAARRSGAEVTWHRTTGLHGDPSNFVPAAVLRFFELHRSIGT